VANKPPKDELAAAQADVEALIKRGK